MSKQTNDLSVLVAIVEKQSNQIDQLLGIIAKNNDQNSIPYDMHSEIETTEQPETFQPSDINIPDKVAKKVNHGLCTATTKAGNPCKNKAISSLRKCRVHSAKSVPVKANVWVNGNQKGKSLLPYFEMVNKTINDKSYTNKIVLSGMKGSVALAKLFDLGYYAKKANNHKVKVGESLPFVNNELIMYHDDMPNILYHSEFGFYDKETKQRTRSNRYIIVG